MVNEYGGLIALTANHILPDGDDMVSVSLYGLEQTGLWD